MSNKKVSYFEKQLCYLRVVILPVWIARVSFLRLCLTSLEFWRVYLLF